jgi:4a-hydroxytetrahydrobiopterin dehydratase
MPYAEPLTDAELAAALRDLPEWTRDGATIRRTVRLAGFRAAVALVNAVADAAEAANHHPDICVTGYRNVSFELSTHAAGALTRRDIELATEIDRLIIGPA